MHNAKCKIAEETTEKIVETGVPTHKKKPPK